MAAVVAVGVPLIVILFPLIAWVTPSGNPVIVIPVAFPPSVYWMGVMGVLMQVVWLALLAAELRTKVGIGLTTTEIAALELSHPAAVCVT